MRWSLLGIVLAGCGGANQELTLLFPDQISRSLTREVAYTAFEPILAPGEGDTAPTFVSCKEVGPFPPTRVVDPDGLRNLSRLGAILAERTTEKFPLEGDWKVNFPEPDPDNVNNPWGAVMVYLEARGDARSSIDQGGQVIATLLSGCYCIRTIDATHPDRRLDQAVKAECQLLGDESLTDVQKQVTFNSVAGLEFTLDSCGSTSLTGPRGALLAPGPSVCMSVVRCDDNPQAPNCFRCQQPCTEVNDQRNVPVVFTVDQPGGSAGPTSQVVLTDVEGRARANIQLDDCQQPITVNARVAGRSVGEVRYEVECVAPVQEFDCGNEIPLVAQEPAGLARLPGPNGIDSVAIVSSDGQDSTLVVHNPAAGTSVPPIEYIDEVARGVYGYYFRQPGAGEASEPMLAVATSRAAGTLHLYLYTWDGSRLTPVEGMNGAIVGCQQWSCGSQLSCADGETCPSGEVCQSDGICVERDTNGSLQRCPNGGCSQGEECERLTCLEGCSGLCMRDDFTGSQAPCNGRDPCAAAGESCREPICLAICPIDAPARCACTLRVEFTTEVLFLATDSDADGLAELHVGATGSLPIITYRAQSSGPRYLPETCRCARFAQMPVAFALVSWGGVAETASPRNLDMVLGAAGGAFVKYADGEGQKRLSCGQSGRFGELVPVRDVKAGRFACPRGSAACDDYDDVVVVAAKTLGGGTFDDPGTLRVVFGGPQDVSRITDLSRSPGTNVELLPRVFEGRAAPRDPRSVEVADFNGDGNDDISILFGSSDEVHVWLGAGNRGVGEVERGVSLDRCALAASPNSKCSPYKRFATPDFDGDGKAEVAVICSPSGSPQLRWFTPR